MSSPHIHIPGVGSYPLSGTQPYSDLTTTHRRGAEPSSNEPNRPRPGRSGSITILILFFLIALLCGFAALHYSQEDREIVSRGVETTAQIADKKEQSVPDGYPSRGFHPVWVVTLHFNDTSGQTHDVHVRVNTRVLADTLQPGHSVAIKYLPDNPKVFRLASAQARSESDFGFGATILAGVAALIGIVIVAAKLRWG